MGYFISVALDVTTVSQPLTNLRDESIKPVKQGFLTDKSMSKPDQNKPLSNTLPTQAHEIRMGLFDAAHVVLFTHAAASFL